MSDVFGSLSESFDLNSGETQHPESVTEVLGLTEEVIGVLPHITETGELDFVFTNPVIGPITFEEELEDTWTVVSDLGIIDNELELVWECTGEIDETILGSIPNSLVLSDTTIGIIDTAIPLVGRLELHEYLIGYIEIANRQFINAPIGN